VREREKKGMKNGFKRNEGKERKGWEITLPK